MDYCGKKYKLKSSVDFDDFMKSIGVGLITRKTAAALSPVTELLKNEDGSFTLVMTTPIRATRITFRLGEDFAEERADGAKVQTIITMEGDVMTQIQKDSRGRTTKFVREFGPKELKVTATVDGWDGTCVRIYEAIN